jgi:hypothetical protein
VAWGSLLKKIICGYCLKLLEDFAKNVKEIDREGQRFWPARITIYGCPKFLLTYGK